MAEVKAKEVKTTQPTEKVDYEVEFKKLATDYQKLVARFNKLYSLYGELLQRYLVEESK